MNRRGLWLVGLMSLVCVHHAGARPLCEPTSGQVASVQGTVELRRAARQNWLPVRQGDRLCPGDRMRVGGNSRAGVTLSNETLLRLDQATTVTFSVRPDKPSLLDLLRGALHLFSRTPQRLEVQTPFVNAGIEGTEFALRTANAATAIWVYEGRVQATNEFGKLRLGVGEAAIARRGQAPRPQLVLKPRDAVQWALYYPPLIDARALAASAGNALRRAAGLYRVGDVPAALKTLDAIPRARRDARYSNLEAALLLAVGRVEEARFALARTRRLAPRNATPLAYDAIIALRQNRQDQARALARQAVSLAPGSAVAHATLSYVRQAAFDIEGARESARRSVELAPGDALTRARLAELALAGGDVDMALRAAREAARLDPDLSRTQTVLGFVHLARIDTEQARTAFETAIKRDQADPLPRLGYGLARIREGDLEAGRREIEIAASLDPSQSLVRSYLGKTYFEEKRAPLAAEQYAMAKELDPNDPTPWFYDAILKQTENRPVEALKSIQRSIELNDNRAVYRSRLLLDEDLAARSASQARIYRNLGFEQLALVEGWKSVNTDPSSHGAHRLLADSYSALPRHEIARVSELLQSQLLQPLNLTPIQPQLAESNLAIIETAGPSTAAVNEFNPLFTRNQALFQLNGIGGGNGTWGNDLVAAGIHDEFALSLGQFHYETEGFRPNADLDQNIYNALAQFSPSPRASVQFEAQTREVEFGDLDQRFDGNFSPADRREIDTDVLRAGFRYSPSPQSDFIGSFIHQDETDRLHREFSFADADVAPGLLSATVDDEIDARGYTFEGQHLFTTEKLDLVSGVGYFTRDSDRTRMTSTVTADGAPIGAPGGEFAASEDDTVHHNAHVYATLHPVKPLALTLGASYSNYDSDNIDRERLNPKFGLLWTPTARLTLRLAAFSALRRPLFRSQTIEPTQIAGFNQIFDDSAASTSKRYGIGIDYKASDALYGGLELTRRDVDFSLIGAPDLKFEEDFHRVYVNWTPTKQIALGAQLEYEKLDIGADPRTALDPRIVLEADRIRTWTLPIGAAYFDDNGFFTNLTASHVDQDVVSGERSGADNFWILDYALGYRLPRRYGIVSLNVQNLLDEEFLFQDRNFLTDEPDPRFIPERTVYARFTLSF